MIYSKGANVVNKIEHTIKSPEKATKIDTKKQGNTLFPIILFGRKLPSCIKE